MQRRQFLQLGLAALAAPAVAACSSGAAQQAASSSASGSGSAAAGSTTIGLTYIPNVQFAPWYWALDKGLFSSEGATVTLRHHGAQEALFTALTAGKENFAVAGGDEMLQARSQGMKLVSIATVYRTYPVVVIVPSSSSITKLADLKGHKIGVPGEYGETWFGLLVALKNAGLSQSDVTVQAIGYTQESALATGKVDAVMGYSNNDVVQFAQNKISVRSIALGSSVPLVGISLITTEAYLSANPDICGAVARATVAGMKAVAADPTAAVKVSASHVTGLSTATEQTKALATLKATTALYGSPITGVIDPSAWSDMASFMKTAGILTTTVPVAPAINTNVLTS